MRFYVVAFKPVNFFQYFIGTALLEKSVYPALCANRRRPHEFGKDFVHPLSSLGVKRHRSATFIIFTLEGISLRRNNQCPSAAKNSLVDFQIAIGGNVFDIPVIVGKLDLSANFHVEV